MSDAEIVQAVATIFTDPYRFNDFIRGQQALLPEEKLWFSVWY